MDSSNGDDTKPSAGFSKWLEANINDEDYNRGDTDINDDNAPDGNGGNAESNQEEEDPAALFRMFGEEEEDVYEDVRYEYQTATSPDNFEIVIRHHGAYPNSTGLAVWRGSEILARFLCQQQNLCWEGKRSESILELHDKTVLEVGAGAGLPGIVAHKVLGAARVLVTDGDYDALQNLQTNVEANKLRERGSTRSLACLQLIWGRGVAQFKKAYGLQDVVLAADCVYMGPSLQPLWQTLDALLKPEGLFVYCQTAASAVPWKDFSEQVDAHGFEVLQKVVGSALDQYDVDNEDDLDKDDDARRENEAYERGIYVFRRKKPYLDNSHRYLECKGHYYQRHIC